MLKNIPVKLFNEAMLYALLGGGVPCVPPTLAAGNSQIVVSATICQLNQFWAFLHDMGFQLKEVEGCV